MEIDSNKARLDLALVHGVLSEQSTWARGIPFATFEKSVQNSLCFGGYLGGNQIAFARVISDFATFAKLADVFVLPEHRGNGFSKLIVQAVVSHPELQGLRRFTLVTNTAHSLYAQFGFTPVSKPESFMERYVPDIYLKSEK